MSTFRKIIGTLFALRPKYKPQRNDLLKKLVNLITNSPRGVQVRKGNNETYKCESQNWIETENDDNVLDY